MGPGCHTCGGLGTVRAIATALADCDGEGKVLSFLHGTVRVLPCRACRTPAGATS